MAGDWSRCGHVLVLLLCLAVSADQNPPAAAGDLAGGGGDGGDPATVAELLRRGRQFAAGKEWERALVEFEAARGPGRGGGAPAGHEEERGWRAEDWRAYGSACFKLSAHARACVPAMARACRLSPAFCPELSLALRSQGDNAAAVATMVEAAHFLPASSSIWFALAVALTHNGEYHAAARAYLVCTRLDPSDHRFSVNLAQSLLHSGRIHTGRRLLHKIAKENPADTRALLILVDHYATHDQPLLLSQTLNTVMSRAPKEVEVLEMFAGIMARIRQYDKALSVRRKVVAENPGEFFPVCKLVQLAQSLAAWDDFEPLHPWLIAHLRSNPADLKECVQPLEATMNPLYSEQDLQFITRYWASTLLWTLPGTQAAANALGAFSPPPHLEGTPRGLKMGYLSSNLQGGAVFLMIQGLWRTHAALRNESGAEKVVTYSSVALDPTNEAGKSYRELEELTEMKRLPYPHDRPGSAGMIRNDGLDVLINVNGWCDAGANELFPARLASVQASYMGYPGSMGSSKWTDILVTDSIASPVEYESHYTEKLLFLPLSYYVNDFANRLPEIGHWQTQDDVSESRAAHGLPDGVFVFACFSRAEKIDRALFTTWLRILARVPTSVFWLLKDTKASRDEDTIVTKNFRTAAAAAGVDPARLLFSDPVDWPKHVRRGALVDLFLDTTGYNAHSTGANSLWAGVPLLTLAGEKMAARVAAGMNRAAFASAYTARTLAEYEVLAVRIATRPAVSEPLRRRFAARRTDAPLFDTRAMVKALERGMAMAADALAANGGRAGGAGSYMHVIPHARGRDVS